MRALLDIFRAVTVVDWYRVAWPVLGRRGHGMFPEGRVRRGSRRARVRVVPGGKGYARFPEGGLRVVGRVTRGSRRVGSEWWEGLRAGPGGRFHGSSKKDKPYPLGSLRVVVVVVVVSK